MLLPYRKRAAEALHLIFIGTRGNTRQRSRRHRRHSSLLIHYAGAHVMIDCGSDWQRSLRSLSPSAIVLTHAHPDHAAGLANGAPCPVFAMPETFASLAAFPIEDKRTVPIGKPFAVGGLAFEAFPVEHSIRAPAVGYRVSAGQSAFFYVPDVVTIGRRRDALRGICLYIGDGATISRPIVRRRQAALIGHTPIATQLGWCAQEGARYAIFTHCGSEIVTGDARHTSGQVRRLGRQRGVYAAIAHDGLELFVDTGAVSIRTPTDGPDSLMNSGCAPLCRTTGTA